MRSESEFEAQQGKVLNLKYNFINKCLCFVGFFNRTVLFCFCQLYEFHVSECTLFSVIGNACCLDLNAFPLSLSAAIFDSIVRVSKNMINPMGHLIM